MDDSVDWRQLREFSDVDLTGSYVLSWHLESETLLVDVDVLLEEKHPFYEKPRPAEKICVRPAIIEFPYCEAMGRKSGALVPPVEIVATLGHGPIKGLRCLADGRYEIEGEFGTVFINAERPLLRLKGR